MERHRVTRRGLIPLAGRGVAAYGAAGVLLAAAVAACGPFQRVEAPEAPKTTQPVRVHWAHYNLDPVRREMQNELIPLFHQRHPGITVEQIPTLWGELAQKLQVMAAGGVDLDVIMGSISWVAPFANLGFYAPLDSFIAKDRFPVQDFHDKTLAGLQWQGKQTALLEMLNILVIYRNKPAFDRAGVAVPRGDWTWDQFVDVAKRLTLRSGDRVEQWGAMGMGTIGLQHGMSWFWNNGGEQFDRVEDPRRSTMVDPRNIETLEWLASWVHQHRVAPRPADIVGQGDLFLAGKVGMYAVGLYWVPTARKLAQFEWDVLPPPRGKAGRFNIVDGQTEGMFGRSKQPEAAWKFLRFWTGADGQKINVLQAHYGVPTLKTLTKQEYMRLPPPPANRQVVVETLEKELRVMPKVPAFFEVFHLYGQIYGEVLNGTMAAREAAEALDQQVNSAIARFSGGERR